MGHSRAGAVPNHHDGVLPGCDGYHAGVRHHAGKVLRKHQKLDPEHRRERLGRRGKDAAGEQMRTEREATGHPGSRRTASSRVRYQVYGNIGES